MRPYLISISRIHRKIRGRLLLPAVRFTRPVLSGKLCLAKVDTKTKGGGGGITEGNWPCAPIVSVRSPSPSSFSYTRTYVGTRDTNRHSNRHATFIYFHCKLSSLSEKRIPMNISNYTCIYYKNSSIEEKQMIKPNIKFH